jgi:23S rRNA (guanosine2251-2'-O)-methyltransferase
LKNKATESLKKEKQRGEWLYGINPVLEALKAGSRIESIYISSGRYDSQVGRKIREQTEKANLPLKVKDINFFNKTFPKGHQGVAARVLQKEYTSFEELLRIPFKKEEPAFFIILDGIEDPRNLGAILRTAEAGGVHGIITQSHRSAGFSSTVYKTSAGAAEHISVARVSNIKYAIDILRNEGIRIYGTDAQSKDILWDMDFRGPLAIVLGSEGSGIRKTVKKRCDQLIRIPLKGKVTSLNVSVAAAILIYEVLRQRK